MTSVGEIPRARSTQRIVSLASYGIGPFALLAVWYLRQAGMIANISLLLLAGLLAFTIVANLGTALWVKGEPASQVRLHARAAASTLSTAAIIYAAGWGALLIVAFALGSAELLRTVGPAISRPNLLWNFLAIGAGEFAVHIGWAPSTVEVRVSHAVAIAGAICLALVTKVLGQSAEATETAETIVRERAARFESLVEHAADVIGVVTVNGTIVAVSPATESMLGFPPEELTGRPVSMVLANEDFDVHSILAGIAGDVGRATTFEARLRHRDGSERLVIATLSKPSAAWRDEIAINLHDITTQRELEERLRHDARHDALTGLLNRKAFGEASEYACARAAKHQRTVGMLYIDLDGFKEINDSFGHDMGDQVLIETSKRLARCISPAETLARLGGDEFAILIGLVDDNEAIVLSETILEELARPIPGLPDGARVGASIGIALRSSEGIEISNLMQEADEAMYSAKRSGRSRWVLANAERRTTPAHI